MKLTWGQGDGYLYRPPKTRTKAAAEELGFEPRADARLPLDLLVGYL